MLDTIQGVLGVWVLFAAGLCFSALAVAIIRDVFRLGR